MLTADCLRSLARVACPIRGVGTEKAAAQDAKIEEARSKVAA
ncbi:hypothetical protein ACFP2T_00085 [Plantactinospora solaniradicis]|uniref:Uncharacterized protein n=1 Tax=Plantactinospora solaniradicis TaxID=1723736 RepID=A0ABW1JYM2_9ACTN